MPAHSLKSTLSSSAMLCLSMFLCPLEDGMARADSQSALNLSLALIPHSTQKLDSLAKSLIVDLNNHGFDFETIIRRLSYNPNMLILCCPKISVSVSPANWNDLPQNGCHEYDIKLRLMAKLKFYISEEF